MADAATQAQLQKLSETFQSLQAELQTTVDGRQKLESQMQENSMVLTELNLVGDGRSVYNKIGPVLLKQDKAEAVMAVKSRIDYITGEMCVVGGCYRHNFCFSITTRRSIG